MILLKHISLGLLLFWQSLTLLAQSENSIVRNEISEIVTELKHENKIHFGYPVGFSGRPERDNKYYKLYEQLQRKATDNDLKILTSDSSKYIVVYAFKILWERNYPDLKKIFLQHIEDNFSFRIAEGCTGSTTKVNLFMFELLCTAVDSQKEYFTKEEQQYYSQKLRTLDKSFICY